MSDQTLLDVTVTPAAGGSAETFRAIADRTEGETIAEQDRVFTLEDDTERRFNMNDYWFQVVPVEETN